MHFLSIVCAKFSEPNPLLRYTHRPVYLKVFSL